MPQPTQTRRPWRTTVRTVFQGLVAACAVIPLMVGALEVDQTTPIVAVVLGVAAGVTRVMALPQVEAWLTRFVPWLAADPEDRP